MGMLNMEKIDPHYQKNAPKTDPFFLNRGHTNFRKIDPFSVKFRMMMRTFYMWEWRDRGTTVFYEWREDVGLIRVYCCLGEEWMDHQGSGIFWLYM